MTTPFTRHLVSTKFSPPRIGAKHVQRTGLLTQLDRIHQCRLALVTGSAGYGKTTLLAQWRQSCLKAGAEVAWLSLSPDDDGYAAFCTALFAALQRVGIAVAIDMSPEDTSAASMDAAVSAIVDGAAALAGDVYLILDDYHVIEAPPAHKLTQKLLDHGPGNLHLVIASRVTPPLSLSRLRVMDQIVELDSAELPFNPAETRVFLDENLGPAKLNADELSLIHDLTNGWPSCLQLIVIMLKNRPDTRVMLTHLVWRSSDLQTYLSEEVMANLPPELAAFAEAASIFRRFNAPLAEAVTGQPHTASLLKQMEDENLLITRVDSDDRSVWYRFHPLFGEFLATRLERRGSAAVRELHRRGSQWFAANGFLADAIRHASLGDDLEFATAVIERAAPATWSLEYLSPTLHLLDRLPEETLFKHQRLLFLACLTIALTARPGKAEAWLAHLQASGTPAHPDMTDSLPVIQAAIAVQRDDMQRVIELLEPHRDAAMENPFLHYVLLAELASAYSAAGQYTKARRLLEAHPIPLADRDNDMALVAESTAIERLMLAGEVREAERVGSLLLARSAKALGHRSISANLCAGGLADAYYELDRIDDARETIANRRGLLQSSVPEIMIRASLCRARLDLLQESPDLALSFLQQQAAHMRSLGQERAFAHLLAEQANVLLIKGQRARATEVSASLDELARNHPNEAGFRAEFPALAALARARVLLPEDPVRALQALDIVRSHARAFGRGRLLALVDVLRGAALDDMKRSEDAIASMTAAVEAAHRLGLVRTLVDEGALAGRQLSRLVREKRLPGQIAQYAETLLEKFSDTAPADPAARTSRGSNAAKTQAVLTQREIEILALVAQAMSNKRIALTLNITLETVKWNLRNIFSKLGVSSRYDAMVWARKQDLIR
ncbi:LuxR C-terminal-related transcriptional regulator [Paraburkholderia sp. GAS334]|uniref:LuxR C-terminal-related transcriptional regulator n=1 Tax=Paraburkholderia sp. GAS334 TaxID=3035131 RepID=UPI003D1E8ED7